MDARAMSGVHHPPLESGTALPPASKVAGPYRAEFGAILHEDNPGFLFTLSPPTAADEVARALNLAHEAENRRPDRDCVSLLADLDAGKPVGAEAAAVIRRMILERDTPDADERGDETEDATILAMCKAHDTEEAAQKGEPSPWREDFERDTDWEQERFFAMREAFDAARVFFAANPVQPGVVETLREALKPFACEPHEDYDDSDNFGVYFKVGDIRRAARTLAALAPVAAGEETVPFPTKIKAWPREEGDCIPDEVGFVLGLAAKPWVLQQVWSSLRLGGVVFPAKAEAEFAAALHWLVVHVLTPGSGGADTIDAALTALRASAIRGNRAEMVITDGLEEG